MHVAKMMELERTWFYSQQLELIGADKWSH
jgi:hypothetical protein